MRCQACDRENPDEHRFCGFCGTRLAPAAAPVALPEVRAASEYKHVTVLLVDIVSSTELVAHLDAEDAMQRLRPALDRMCAVVERFGGTIVRTLGDGLMAVFGAPRALEGHALLACEASIALHAAFPPGPAALSLRVGLHSGEVVADAPFAAPVGEPGAHGMTVHVASRVAALAAPGGTVLTAAAARLAEGRFALVSEGDHALRGVPDRMAIFRLAGPLSEGQAPAPASGASTTFRGRDWELALLRRALAAAKSGEPRIVGLVGPPGMGKSRLCLEFAAWSRRSRCATLYEARAQVYGHATPLQPILELLRQFFPGAGSNVDPQEARRSVAARLAAFDPPLDADHALICTLLGIGEASTPAAVLNPKVWRARLLDVIRRMIRDRPTEDGEAGVAVFILEDLQWFDEASLEFVSVLCCALVETRTLLVLTYRSGFTAAWQAAPPFEEIGLREIGLADVAALVGELVGRDPALADLRRRVTERSGGNPFFAEELVRSLVENKLLAGEPGLYRPGSVVVSDVLPANLRSVIGARIDRLDAFERDLLLICAIIGHEVPHEILRRISDAAAPRVDAGIERLRQTEMLQARHGAEQTESVFRHPLIQEVAYSTQLKARRSALHASVAAVMAAHFADRLDEQAGLLAYHYEAAGDPVRTVEFATRAAYWIAPTSPAQAITYWRQVRTLLAEMPDHADRRALCITANTQIAFLSWREGIHVSDASALTKEAIGWAQETDDQMVPLLLFVDARVGLSTGGSADEYVTRMQSALPLLQAGRSDRGIAIIYASLCQAYGWAGLLAHALAAGDSALARIDEVRPEDNQLLGFNAEYWVHGLRGRLLVRFGRIDEARASFDLVLRLDPARTDPILKTIAHFGYVELAVRSKDATLALHHAGLLAYYAEMQKSPYIQVFALVGLALANACAHGPAAARAAFEQSIEIVHRSRVALEFEPEILAEFALNTLRQGQPQEAAKLAERARLLAHTLSARMAECLATIVLAHALMVDCQKPEAAWSEAAALIDRARTLLAETGSVAYAGLLEEVFEMAPAGPEQRRARTVNSRNP